ncbi:MAG: hypothetical protein AB8E15_05010 [Bdellovibrionales bacterium]
MKNNIFMICLIFSVNGFGKKCPTADPTWWTEDTTSQAKKSWEILPSQVKKGQLILSKRNALGQFSNLAPTAFVFEGDYYASLEALWQMMKYPNPNLSEDPRNTYALKFPYTRDEVRLLANMESKKAGDAANALNKKNGVKEISYEATFFDYKDKAAGSSRHYEIIFAASVEKLRQNPKLIDLLLRTCDLELLPDHKISSDRPNSYFYNQIYMKLRDKIRKNEL